VNLSQTLVGAFAEDRWRVSPALTVTYGVRWDYDDLTSRGESTPDLNNFQPRLSVNWLASPSTVLRAGAGLYAGSSRTRSTRTPSSSGRTGTRP
jgi:outer membrane receptor protein involved in Fe transport